MTTDIDDRLREMVLGGSAYQARELAHSLDLAEWAELLDLLLLHWTMLWLDLKVTSQLSRTEVFRLLLQLLTLLTLSLSSTTSFWNWISRVLLLSTLCT